MEFSKATGSSSNLNYILPKLIERLDDMEERVFSVWSFQSVIQLLKSLSNSGLDTLWLVLISCNSKVYLLVERGCKPWDISINRRNMTLEVVGLSVDSEESGPRWRWTALLYDFVVLVTSQCAELSLRKYIRFDWLPICSGNIRWLHDWPMGILPVPESCLRLQRRAHGGCLCLKYISYIQFSIT
jgi:hypothetical protein